MSDPSQEQQHDDSWHDLRLHPDHKADLQKSGLFAATVRGLNIHTILPRDIRQHLSFRDERITSVLCFPYPNEEGFCRDKIFPVDLKDKDGHGLRYLQRSGSGCRLYIPPHAQAALSDARIPLLFTEGEKKAAKACQEGYACIGLGGLWNFAVDGRLLPRFDRIVLDGRDVILIPDSEVWTDRPDLLRPVHRFARLLEERGAHVTMRELYG